MMEEFLYGKKKTSRLVNLMLGDRHVVNVISGHPFNCVMATSGIENNVKIWEPTCDTPADLTIAAEVAAANHTQRQQTSTGNAIPLSVLRRLIHTGLVRHGDSDDDDEDSNGEGADDVECRPQ